MCLLRKVQFHIMNVATQYTNSSFAEMLNLLSLGTAFYSAHTTRDIDWELVCYSRAQFLTIMVRLRVVFFLLF